MADNYAPEIRQSFHLQGFMTRVDETSRFATEGEAGRSDLVVLKNGKGCAVEIKAGVHSFSFADWRDNQRSWAKIWCEDYSKIPYWIALAIGINGVAAPKKGLRHCWVIPYTYFEKIELLIKPYQNSIPYKIGKGFNLEMQQLKYDCVNLFKLYQCEWVVEKRTYYYYDVLDKKKPVKLWRKATEPEFLNSATFIKEQVQIVQYWKFPNRFLEVFD